MKVNELDILLDVLKKLRTSVSYQSIVEVNNDIEYCMFLVEELKKIMEDN